MAVLLECKLDRKEMSVPRTGVSTNHRIPAMKTEAIFMVA